MNATALTYDLDYQYDPSKGHQLDFIWDPISATTTDFTYNTSGSITQIDDPSQAIAQNFFWNEQQQLTGVSNQQGVHHYVYDHSGERIMKSSLINSKVYLNDQVIDDVSNLEPYTVYVNPYYVVTGLMGGDRVSKHYYMNQQRVATDITINYDPNGTGGGQQEQASAKGTSSVETVWSPALKQFNKVLVGLGQKPLDTASLKLPTIASYYPEAAKTPATSSSAEGNPSAPRILFWYHPDYLGNVDLITERDGYTNEFFMYNPWGEEMHQWNANTYAFTSPYRFNSKELDPETGLAYYGARYYQNKLGVWLSVDPLALAGQSVNKTPFHFSSNNPSMRIDPDGLSDYFTEDGTFLGSDNSEFDDVRIMSLEIWNRFSTEDISGVRSISEEIGINASKIASKSNLNIESQLSIYQHYNPMNIELTDSDSRTDIGAKFRGYSDGSSKLLIHVCRNESQQIIDHFEQINSIFAHEKRHYDDFRELGFEGYEQTPHDLRERRAYQSQLEHSSWRKVSRDFKDRVLKTAVDEYNFIEPIQVPIKSINFLR